ncbi:ATP-binding protein [Streptomyces populi]
MNRSLKEMGSPGALEASFTLDCDDSRIFQARRLAIRFLTKTRDQYGVPVAAAAIEIVQLIVSELITNARKYAPRPALLHLRILGAVLRVEVGDSSPVAPAAREADPQRTGQHGLEIVTALALAVTVETARGTPAQGEAARLPGASRPPTNAGARNRRHSRIKERQGTPERKSRPRPRRAAASQEETVPRHTATEPVTAPPGSFRRRGTEHGTCLSADGRFCRACRIIISMSSGSDGAACWSGRILGIERDASWILLPGKCVTATITLAQS